MNGSDKVNKNAFNRKHTNPREMRRAPLYVNSWPRAARRRSPGGAALALQLRWAQAPHAHIRAVSAGSDVGRNGGDATTPQQSRRAGVRGQSAELHSLVRLAHAAPVLARDAKPSCSVSASGKGKRKTPNLREKNHVYGEQNSKKKKFSRCFLFFS